MLGRTNTGGAGLNFKVVGGTTQPSSPKENTIWVNTDTPITSWDFSSEAPPIRSNNKNLITHPYYHTGHTYEGVTFTVNADGTITTNGTATGNANIRLNYTSYDKKLIHLKKGTYTLSGCPAGGSDDTYFFEAVINGTADYFRDYGNGVTFTLDKDIDIRCAIWIYTTVSNLVFRPQLEKGSVATDFVRGDATGQVWTATGSGSTTPFNALRKNALMVYPIKVYQYINGAWVAKAAKTYQGGEWCEWALFIYKDGKLSEITGFTMTGGTATDADGVLTFESSSTTVIKLVARSTERIDFTGYETLAVNFLDGSKVYRGVNLTGAGVGFGVTVEVPSVTTKEFSTGEQPIVSNAAAWHLFDHTVNNNAQPSGELTLDVSGVDAGYLVFLGRAYGSNWKAVLKVDSIKFE